MGGGGGQREEETQTGISRTCVIVQAGKFRVYMASWWLEILRQESMLVLRQNFFCLSKTTSITRLRLFS